MDEYRSPTQLLADAAAINVSMTTFLARCEVAGLIDFEAQQLHRSLASIGRCAETAMALLAHHRRNLHGHRTAGAKDVANDCASTQGVSPSAVQRAIGVVEKLGQLSEIDAAARRGELSTRELELIAGAAAHNPTQQQRLLDAKAGGLTALKAECVRVRRESETSAQTRARLRNQRSLRMWSDAESMLHIHAAFSGEDGGHSYLQLADAVRQAQRVLRRNTPQGELPPTAEQTGADVFLTLLQRGLQPSTTPPTPSTGDDVNEGDDSAESEKATSRGHNDDAGTSDRVNDDGVKNDRESKTSENNERATQCGVTVNMLAGWNNRRSPAEYIINLDAFLRGYSVEGETCELVGVGEVSAELIRGLLPGAFVKFITLRGPRDPVAVCHIGHRVPNEVRRALCLETDPPESRSRPPWQARSNLTVNIVLAADRVGDYAQAIGEIIQRRGKPIPLMVSSQHYINAYLRTALLVSGYVCSEPGCNTRGYLEIDHDIEHSSGGLTSWQNLRYLCWHHHSEKTQRYNRRRHPKRARQESPTQRAAHRRPDRGNNEPFERKDARSPTGKYLA